MVTSFGSLWSTKTFQFPNTLAVSKTTGIVSRGANSYVMTDEFDYQVKAQGNRKTRLDCAMEKNVDEYFFNQITECTFSCPEANIWPGSWAFFHVTGRFAFANFIYIFTLELLFYEFLFSLPWLPLVVQFGHGIMLFTILTLKTYAS